MAPVLVWDGLRYIDVVTGIPYESFQSGVTRPVYDSTIDYSGARNVGTNPNVELVPYEGTITNGVITLVESDLYENVLFPGPVDVRNEIEMRNCAIEVPKTFSGSVLACLTVLNGGTATKNVKFKNVEIRNKAQRPMNGFMGRNSAFEKSVVLGCVDGFAVSTSGSAPLTTGIDILDSIVPELAFWYSPVINPIIHGSDTMSHSDGIQHNNSLQVNVTNTALYGYVSEFIGTGTPGSGSESNPWNPPTGHDFIQSQAQMEIWRNQFAGSFTLAHKSPDGKSHRLSSGSFAPIMLNDPLLTADRCYFAGGNVQINAADSALPEPNQVRLRNNTHWNDMRSGPGSRSTNPDVKGYAVMQLTGRNFTEYTNNKWDDGTSVAITRL